MNLSDQRWIKGYEKKYSCNSQGQMFRHYKNGKSTELSGYFKKNMHVVKLTNERGSKVFVVSRLIYEAWIGEIPTGMIVTRKNKNPFDSHITNLKLTTYKERGKNTGARAKSKAVELLDEDGEVIDSWSSARKAAKDLFVSRQTITDICNKRCKYKCVNVRWARKESEWSR